LGGGGVLEGNPWAVEEYCVNLCAPDFLRCWQLVTAWVMEWCPMFSRLATLVPRSPSPPPSLLPSPLYPPPSIIILHDMTQTAVDVAGNAGNTVTLSLAVLSLPPLVAFTARPPPVSNHSAVVLTATVGLVSTYVSGVWFTTLNGSASLPVSCPLPVFVSINGTASASAVLTCTDLSSGVYRCVAVVWWGCKRDIFPPPPPPPCDP
jgi:hypothetical protein